MERDRACCAGANRPLEGTLVGEGADAQVMYQHPLTGEEGWVSIVDTDMAHLEDAVTWWNNVGIKLGPKSPAVRAWMLDSANVSFNPTGSTVCRVRGSESLTRCQNDNELEPALHVRIEQISSEGNKLAESGDTLGAWKKFLDEVELVPEPKTDWEATTWRPVSIGDMAFVRGKFDKARDALEDAVRCPNGLGNAFIHLWFLRETLFELGDRRCVADELVRAYMADGRRVFARENPKYFGLVEQVLKVPAGHEQLP